jgi:hypothetical protein
VPRHQGTGRAEPQKHDGTQDFPFRMLCPALRRIWRFRKGRVGQESLT